MDHKVKEKKIFVFNKIKLIKYINYKCYIKLFNAGKFIFVVMSFVLFFIVNYFQFDSMFNTSLSDSFLHA